MRLKLGSKIRGAKTLISWQSGLLLEESRYQEKTTDLLLANFIT
jgi:hypothetical protein